MFVVVFNTAVPDTGMAKEFILFVLTLNITQHTNSDTQFTKKKNKTLLRTLNCVPLPSLGTRAHPAHTLEASLGTRAHPAHTLEAD